MANARWEARTIASCISERDLVFEPIKGKHLYHTGEEKKQVTGTPFLYKELELSDLNSKKYFSL